MKTKYNNSAVTAYILNSIDADGYDNDAPMSTTKEKLAFLDKTFRAEYGWAISRMGYQNAMKEWAQGLPSAFNVAYLNYEIIKLAYEWGSLSTGASEKEEYKIVENWFNFIAAKTTMLINKNK